MLNKAAHHHQLPSYLLFSPSPSRCSNSNPYCKQKPRQLVMTCQSLKIYCCMGQATGSNQQQQCSQYI
jgi:hypothetical protein